MIPYIVIGGKFDDQGGRPSGYVKKLYGHLSAINPGGSLINGGSFSDLKGLVDVIESLPCKAMLWFPDVPNDKEKLIKQIKVKNTKLLLVTSKNNLDRKYSFMELVARALQVKANLFVEFTDPVHDPKRIHASVCDPLGNCFSRTEKIEGTAVALMSRLEELSKFTRMASKGDGLGELPVAPPEGFIDLIRHYAEVYHDLIHPADGSRFLGNASFRCESGFPSFRTEEGIYVSRRNVDKRSLGAESFVEVRFLNENSIFYDGPNKPSVDTPIQLMLYRYYTKIRFMLHSHVYITGALETDRVIPCGAVEEFYEILKLAPDRNSTLIQVNLKGHSSLIMADSLPFLHAIKYESRPVPEVQYLL